MVGVVIKSAEIMREAAKPGALAAEVERLKREKIYQEKREKAVKEVIEYFKTKIEEETRKGKTSWHSHEIYENSYLYKTLYSFFKDLHFIKELFEKAGYSFWIHEYSDSWKRRSGKIAFVSIYWDE